MSTNAQKVQCLIYESDSADGEVCVRVIDCRKTENKVTGTVAGVGMGVVAAASLASVFIKDT